MFTQQEIERKWFGIKHKIYSPQKMAEKEELKMYTPNFLFIA